MPLLNEIMTSFSGGARFKRHADRCGGTMRAVDVRAIPFCDGDKRLGMIPNRELVLCVRALSRSSVDALGSDAMTPGLVYSFEDQDTEVAAELMIDKQIRRIPSLSKKHLVGIVS